MDGPCRHPVGGLTHCHEPGSAPLQAFDELDGILARQPYLGGDAPDRTDITAAALLAPVCAPPEHIVKWPAVPAELIGFQDQLRGRPAWNHVGRMYREHRRARAAA